MDVYENMTYKESVLLVDLIKQDYEALTLFFDTSDNRKELLRQKYSIKKQIYSLNFEEWKKDKLWEYINDDVEYSQLWRFI